MESTHEHREAKEQANEASKNEERVHAALDKQVSDVHNEIEALTVRD